MAIDQKMPPFLALPKKGGSLPRQQYRGETTRHQPTASTIDVDMDGMTLEESMRPNQYDHVKNKTPDQLFQAMHEDKNFARLVLSNTPLKRMLFLKQQQSPLSRDTNLIDIQKEQWKPNTILLKPDAAVGGLSRTFRLRKGDPASYRITCRTLPIDEDAEITAMWSHFEITTFTGEEQEALGQVEVLPAEFLDTYLTDTASYILADLDSDLLFSEQPAVLIPPGKTLGDILEFLKGWYFNGKYYKEFKGFQAREWKNEFFGRGGLIEVRKVRNPVPELKDEKQEEQEKDDEEQEDE